MNVKKSKSANLESRKLMFFQIGMVVAISLSLISFEWRTASFTPLARDSAWVNIPEEDPIDITFRKSKPLPPPPPVLKKNVDVLLIGNIEAPVIEPIIEIVEPPKAPETVISIVEPNEKEEVVPFVLVEEKPIFPGCEGLDKSESFTCFQKSLMQLIVDSVVYPKEAKQMGIEGKVFVSFVINKEGLVDDVKIARSVDRYLDNEALRVVKLMPKMTPAMQRNKPVSIMYSVPIAFNIN